MFSPEILINIQKPARYLNSEYGSIYKKSDNKKILKWCLVYPELYEIGMSSLGFQIVYHLLNKLPFVYAERSFMPWIDAIEEMEKRKIPLFSLETKTPLKNFDIVGFSVHTEMNYTNILKILEISGIPLRNDEREKPIIALGGPTSLNPLPMSKFIDFFVVGEFEEIYKEINQVLYEWKMNNWKKEKVLEKLSKIEGIYIPNLTKRVKRVYAKELKKDDFPIRQIVPNIEIVHTRYVVEIMRGCGRGCRFCEGGYVYRPPRFRDFEQVIEIMDEGIGKTGYDEISFLAFTPYDYPYFYKLLEEAIKRKIKISLPALPIEAIDERIFDILKNSGKFGITLAPETPCEKLRKIINKRVSIETIFKSIEFVKKLKWKHIKLYFMIGLPQEDFNDIREIVYFVKKIANFAKKTKIKIAISPLTPRPFTPFQYFKNEDINQTKEKLNFIKRSLSKIKNIELSWRKPEMAYVESILAKGDEKLADVIEKVYKLGEIFSSREEFFDFKKWYKVFKEYNIEQNINELKYLKIVDVGIRGKFFEEEYKKSLEKRETSWCFEKCYGCGVFPECRNLKISKKEEIKISSNNFKLEEKIFNWYKFVFEKRGKSRFISHKDFIWLIIRWLRREGVKIEYSKGFHPLPKISSPSATPLGIESKNEIIFIKCNIADKILKKLINKEFFDIKIKKIEKVEKPEKYKFLIYKKDGKILKMPLNSKIPLKNFEERLNIVKIGYE